MKIRIDTRERGEQNRLPRYQRAKKHFEDDKKEAHTVLIEKLPFGDYVFDDKVVFEFKTVKDYMSSLQNGSLFEEVVNQTKEYEYSFLIIVGDEIGTLKSNWGNVQAYWKNNYNLYLKRSKSVYKGSVRRIRTYCNVIKCMTEEEAFEEMLRQAEKCLTPKLYGGTKRLIKTHDIVTHTLSGCDGVSTKTINNIKSTLECETLHELINLKIEDFETVPKIGNKTATKIYCYLH